MQGWDNLPDKYLPNVNSVVQNNPGWTFMRWDDKGVRDLIAREACEYLDKYNSFTLLHQRVDFARYLILYVYGGVSVDTDVLAKKGFDTLPELQTSDFIVSKNSTDSFINNATIIVSEKNPLLKELLDSINPECSFTGIDSATTNALCINNTTGPGMFTKFINEHLDRITVLDNSYFEPCSGYDKSCQAEGIKENTILDHQHEGTWIPPVIKNGLSAIYFFKRNWMLLIMFILIVILVILLLKGK